MRSAKDILNEGDEDLRIDSPTDRQQRQHRREEKLTKPEKKAIINAILEKKRDVIENIHKPDTTIAEQFYDLFGNEIVRQFTELGNDYRDEIEESRLLRREVQELKDAIATARADAPSPVRIAVENGSIETELRHQIAIQRAFMSGEGMRLFDLWVAQHPLEDLRDSYDLPELFDREREKDDLDNQVIQDIQQDYFQRFKDSLTWYDTFKIFFTEEMQMSLSDELKQIIIRDKTVKQVMLATMQEAGVRVATIPELEQWIERPAVDVPEDQRIPAVKERYKTLFWERLALLLKREKDRVRARERRQQEKQGVRQKPPKRKELLEKLQEATSAIEVVDKSNDAAQRELFRAFSKLDEKEDKIAKLKRSLARLRNGQDSDED